MKKKPIQYTIRNVPPRVDQRLREQATDYSVSLNEVAVSALTRASGLDAEPVVHHDLDDLAGSWVSDPALDAALESMDQVDKDLWK